MHAITGVTGRVGGAAARALSTAGEQVRAVLRDPDKVATWTARGCEVAVAEMGDAAGLDRAFAGAEGVFVLLPPVFDPSPDFAEARAVIAAVRAALDMAQPARVVCAVSQPCFRPPYLCQHSGSRQAETDRCSGGER